MRFDREKLGRFMQERSGLAGWLLKLLRNRATASGECRQRLALVERISLAPRQSLVLVEAEGRRILVALSPDGAPAFHALDGYGDRPARSINDRRIGPRAGVSPRVSW